MYIGKTPIVGNFQVCDTISTSATDTFNLLVSSVAVFPETENNVICSLNGVVQKPGSGGGFTISGSTIIFNSALTSADVIDFVILLGSVLNVGTVSDDTITLAKMASGTDGNIISYDASGNPVAIATGSDGQVLTSTGAGSPPAFEAAAAGGLVLQVLCDTTDAQQSTTSNTYADTALSIAITPASADNKILVICNVNMIVKLSGDTSCGIRTLREDVEIQRTSNCNSGSTADRRVGSASWCSLDAPSTTSEITYKVQIANENNGVGTSYMNYSARAAASQLTLMEISG
jgi:hypothetical protein